MLKLCLELKCRDISEDKLVFQHIDTTHYSADDPDAIIACESYKNNDAMPTVMFFSLEDLKEFNHELTVFIKHIKQESLTDLLKK